jgi:hypothetical protein
MSTINFSALADAAIVETYKAETKTNCGSAYGGPLGAILSGFSNIRGEALVPAGKLPKGLWMARPADTEDPEAIQYFIFYEQAMRYLFDVKAELDAARDEELDKRARLKPSPIKKFKK